MSILHNQINRLWFNPSYDKFKNSHFNKHIFSKKDANDFLKTGAYLIMNALQISNLPPSAYKGEENRESFLKNPRLENAFFSLGAEYLMKGVFLLKGYSINKTVAKGQISHPIKLYGNRKNLRENEVYEIGYIVRYLPSILNFDDFNKNQKEFEKKQKDRMKGQKIKGIKKLTIPYPNATAFLDYIHAKRNYALHRPFIIPEFSGLTVQLFFFLGYIAEKGVGKSLKELGNI
jgi:hypothetical protein